MKTIKGYIDPRNENIVQAMKHRDDILLPKTVEKREEKPLIDLEVRRVEHFGCR